MVAVRELKGPRDHINRRILIQSCSAWLDLQHPPVRICCANVGLAMRTLSLLMPGPKGMRRFCGAAQKTRCMQGKLHEAICESSHSHIRQLCRHQHGLNISSEAAPSMCTSSRHLDSMSFSNVSYWAQGRSALVFLLL